MDFIKDLKFDSLERVMFLTMVEQEFNMVFEDNVFDNFKTFDDILLILKDNYKAI